MTPDIPLSSSLVDRVARYGPPVGTFIAVVVGGWIASALARRLVKTLVRRSGIEAFAERAGISRLLYGIGVKEGLASFLGGVAYAGGLVATLSAASDLLGLAVVSSATTALLAYMPRLLTAGAILVGTFAGASILRAFVERMAAKNSEVDSPGAAATIAYVAVAVVGSMLAAEQAGIEVAFLTTLLQIAVAVLGLGLALTFALGFHSVFRNLASRHYYKPLLRVGDRVRIGDDEGTVARFTPTAVVLRTADGDRIIPCDRLLSTTVHVRGAAPASPSP